MIIREAQLADIPGMHKVRVAVMENRLPDPTMITMDEYKDYITNRGKGWVSEIHDTIAGFAIVSLQDHNVWALFVMPGYEKKGMGRMLHDRMMDWYFSKTDEKIWLGTAPQTRAEGFYKKAGWQPVGTRPNGEIAFEMTKNEWENRS